MGAIAERKIRVIFLDLDNTLYDWTRFFVPALRGMCIHLSDLTGISPSQLYLEFRDVFATHGSVEYSWALQELSSLKLKHPEDRGSDIVNRYRPAVRTFQHRRRKWLKLYPGVARGLESMKLAGITRIAVTDAHGWQSANRIRQLNLEPLIDGLVARPDHSDPSADEVAHIRQYAEERYGSLIQRIDLPEGLRKPDPALLQWLISELCVSNDECMYVGDSLTKDIAMSRNAGVLDCWAEYGTRYNPLDMITLTRVTPWSADAVQAVLDPTPERLGIYPTLIASSFEDVVKYVSEFHKISESMEKDRCGTI